MSTFKPVALITTQYLRKMGRNQSQPFKTANTFCCDLAFKRPIYPSQVRLGFIPDEWFQFFYTKTGITGPYVFGLGLLNYIFSKEIYVCDHQFYTGLSMGILCVVAVKKLGPLCAKYCDNEIDKLEKNWRKQHEAELKDLQDMINQECKEQWRAEGNLMLMQAKRENIALQLEAAYRKAIMDVYKDVKNRLDYQVACRFVENRIKHKHMVSWIINQVLEELPKDLDEEVLKRYKINLSAMALRLK